MGATSDIVSELAEYFAFVSRRTERTFAYVDTLGDLALGAAGAVLAGVVLQRLWQRGRLLDPPPPLPVPTLAGSEHVVGSAVPC